MKVRTSVFAFLLASLTAAASFAAAAASPRAPTWTELAKKVGESEDNRDKVIAQLKKIPHLKTKLEKAIYTKDRPLALDTISALEMKDFIPDLLLKVPADPDGFLTVAVNSMMDSKNQAKILQSYLIALDDKPSNAAVVAMLEPLGRLNIGLKRSTLEAFRDSSSPEVRAALIYYVRIMALRNKNYDNTDMLSRSLHAPEFQVRLQTIAVATEIAGAAPATKNIPSVSDMRKVCETEKASSIKAACYSFLSVSPRAPASAPMCKTLEKNLYAHDTLKVRMIFGYKDARPARFVGDRHERLAFIERVTQTCSPGEDECGFVRSHDNADLFLKHTTVTGKDHRVLLWIVNSSVGTDDQENRTDPFQKWKSKYAEEAFTTGLRDADVVMYDGHSRFGGGPDFNSPRLRKDGSVDPSAYQESRPGLTKMLGALTKPSKTPPKVKLLGLFSCSSSQHFNEEIHAVSKTGVVSSKVLMYYSDALEQSLATLADLLTGRCPRSVSF